MTNWKAVKNADIELATSLRYTVNLSRLTIEAATIADDTDDTDDKHYFAFKHFATSLELFGFLESLALRHEVVLEVTLRRE